MFRDAIIREMRRRKWSAYKLAQEANLNIRTVQQFIAGTCDLCSERVAKLCQALGLGLRQVPKRQKGRR